MVFKRTSNSLKEINMEIGKYFSCKKEYSERIVLIV